MLASVDLSMKNRIKKREHSSYKIDKVDAKNMIRAWVFSLPRNSAQSGCKEVHLMPELN